MKKIFLTSGLAMIMASSAFATAHDIDTSNNLVGVTPTTAASCQEPTLGNYTGPSTFYAKWEAKTYNVTYAGGAHTGGTGTSNTATFDTDYQILGLGTTASGITANTGYHFSKWVGTSTGQNPDTAYNALSEAARTYDETDLIHPYQIVGNLTLTANVLPNDSGAITLHPDIYRDNNRSNNATPLYYNSGNTPLLTTPISQTTVYSRYETGLYTTNGFTTQVTAASLKPAQTGYTFDGFYTEDGITQVINDQGVVQSAALTQVSSIGGTAHWYAKWTPKTYTIAFDKGSVSCSTIQGNSPTSQTLTYDLATNLSANGYSATGYTFSGWSSNKNLLSVDGTGNTTNYTDGQSIALKYAGNDAVLTAQWGYIQTGKIDLDSKLYNSQGNEVADHTPGAPVPTALTIKYGQADGYAAYNGNGVDSVTIPTMTGYTFGGYYTQKNGGGTQVITDEGEFIQCTTNTQISTAGQGAIWYAKWTAKPGKIKYTCGTAPSGASTGPAGGTAPAEVSLKYDDSYILATNAPNCALSGYHFKSWKCTHDIDSGTANDAQHPEAGKYAGSGSVNSWTVTQSGTYRVIGDVTCEVVWEANTITTNWNANGGTLTSQGQGTCTYDGSIGIPTTVPNRPGYDFNGWTTTAPSSGS